MAHDMARSSCLPGAHFSTVPVSRISASLRKLGISAVAFFRSFDKANLFGLHFGVKKLEEIGPTDGVHQHFRHF